MANKLTECPQCGAGNAGKATTQCHECNQPLTSVATVVNVKHEDCDLYIGRGPGAAHMNNTPVGEKGWLGNPYPLPKFSRDKSVELFERDFNRRIEQDPKFVAELNKHKGKRLGCFCKPLKCHGDVIAAFLNGK